MEGFLDGFYAVGAVFDGGDGEAGAVMGDTLAKVQLRDEGRFNPETFTAGERLNGSHMANGFYDAAEHSYRKRVRLPLFWKVCWLRVSMIARTR